MPTGGDIIEITYNHPTVGAGVLYPKAGEDSTWDLGGIRSADEANGIDGGGRNIDQMTRVRWFVESTVSWDMNDTKELEKLNAMAGDPTPADWTLSHINGTIYKGKGKPVGDIQGNGNAATIPLKVSGGGKLQTIS